MERIPRHPDRGGEASRFYPRRWHLLLLALACGFAAVVFAIPAFGAAQPWLVGIGAAGLALFAPAGAVLLVRAARPGPSVVIGAEGITDRTTLAPTGLVRWDEITAIRMREIGRGMGAERVLEIMLADPQGFAGRPRSRLRRLSDRYRAALRQPAVSIPGSMVSGPMQALVDEIHRWRPQLVVLEGPPPLARPRLRMPGRRGPQPPSRAPHRPPW